MGDCPELKRWRSRMSGCEVGSASSGSVCSRALVRGEPTRDLIPELQPLANEDVVDGAGKGKIFATDLEWLLRQRGITKLVFCGVTTACCVATTMREALDLGFDCWILADGTGDCSAFDYLDTLRLIHRRGPVIRPHAEVISCASFLTKICCADGPTPHAAINKLPPVRHIDGLPIANHICLGLESLLQGGIQQFESALAAQAREHIGVLQQRAKAEGVPVSANCKCIVADDIGRTGMWPHEPQTLNSKTVLLCLHVQSDEDSEDDEDDEPVNSGWRERLKRLEASATAANLKVIHMFEGAPQPPDDSAVSRVTMPMHGMGAFSGTGLEAWLSRHGVRNLLLAGGAYTINTTMRQASDRGFDTLIVADCVQAVYSPNLYGVTASIIRGLFSATAHSDAVIQWCEQQPAERGEWRSSSSREEACVERASEREY